MSKRSGADQFFDAVREALRNVPWWAGPIVVVLVWAVLYHLVPAALAITAPVRFGPSGRSPQLISSCRFVAFIASGIIGVIWIVTLVDRLFDAHRLDSQTNLDSIVQLHWKEFERLLGEAFRRRGYSVQFTPPGADGGVDLILTNSGKQTLVQAKRWGRKSVGVSVVRELFGVMHARGAHAAIVVTTSEFTPAALQFARESGVELIDGPELERMVASVRKGRDLTSQDQADPSASPGTTRLAIVDVESVGPPVCPACGKPMVKRVAKRGPGIGSAFWGCTGFPTCRGTRRVDS